MTKAEKKTKRHKGIDLNPSTVEWYAEKASTRKIPVKAIIEYVLEKLCAENNQSVFEE